jgi:hypothetical protein
VGGAPGGPKTQIFRRASPGALPEAIKGGDSYLNGRPFPEQRLRDIFAAFQWNGADAPDEACRKAREVLERILDERLQHRALLHGKPLSPPPPRVQPPEPRPEPAGGGRAITEFDPYTPALLQARAEWRARREAADRAREAEARQRLYDAMVPPVTPKITWLSEARRKSRLAGW